MTTASRTTMNRFLWCTAAQYMTSSVRPVSREISMRRLESLFEEHDFNAFPVVEDGKILGIVTKFDFIKAFAFTPDQIAPHYEELMDLTVADVMTSTVAHADPDTPLTRVLQLMVHLKTRSLPVLNPERQLVGIISREDIMRALRQTTGGGCDNSTLGTRYSVRPQSTRALGRIEGVPFSRLR